MSYIHGYDPDTLREITDSRECAERLEEIGSQRGRIAIERHARGARAVP